MFSELSALCQESGLPQIFQSREEATYLISLFLVDKPSNSITSIRSNPKRCCSDIHTADPLHVTVINDLCIDPLIPPTVETLRGRKRKNRIQSQSIVAPTVLKTRIVLCPL